MWFVVTDTFICIDNRAFEKKNNDNNITIFHNPICSSLYFVGRSKYGRTITDSNIQVCPISSCEIKAIVRDVGEMCH